ncbi:MAG: exo-alpha-sialidase [Anaerolineae bacterium]|nr:exo-alpha-sialidase [Anaerolineae bacterium]
MLRIFYLSIIILFTTLLTVNTRGHLALAQEPHQWANVERIPNYDDAAEPPFMIADQNRTVHAFSSETIDSDAYYLIYRQWSLEEGWTDPIDIFARNPKPFGLFMDDAGSVHLAFYRGTEVQADVYYSTAKIADIAQGLGARAWSQEKLVAQDAGPFAFGHIIGDGKNNIFILFEGKGEGNGLYSIHSSDGGNTWSEPITISLTYDEERWATRMSLTMDPQGAVHAVWAEWSSAGVGVDIRYAKLAPDYTEWSKPIVLAEKDPEDYEADNPAIIYFNKELIVVYQDDFPATKAMRTSFDGGQTWSEPVIPWPHKGEYGQANLLVDSNNTLHIILGNRAGDDAHGMWHGVWLENRWSELEPIVTGPKTLQFDPTEPTAVISQGNILLATWDHDSPDPENGIWYSYTELDAPELPVVPLPTVTVLTSAPTVTPIPTLVPSTPSHRPATPIAIHESNLGTISSTPSLPLMLSLIPVSLIIAAVFVVIRLNHR